MDEISDKIFEFRRENILKHKEKIEKNSPETFIIYPYWLISNITILPPPIYDIEYIFEDDSQFSKLSSGESQNIFSLSTILYHINNLSSKHHSHFKDIDIKYKYINIIFDEIELYAHPEMQRNFIKNLLYKIKVSNLRGIESINLLFITHSPFILSDIPKQNVLFLDVIKKVDENNNPILDEKGNEQFFSTPTRYKGDNTFGENIHQMLTDGFFISDAKGAFVKHKIDEFLQDYNNYINTKENSKDYSSLKSNFEDKLDYYEKLISLVGEDYIRKILENHLDELKNHFEIKIDINNEEKNLIKKLIEINPEKYKKLK